MFLSDHLLLSPCACGHAFSLLCCCYYYPVLCCQRDGYDARRHYPKDDYEYYNGPANEGPHNNPYGRDVQITWQSTLPGGIAVAAHDIEDVNNYLAFAKKHVEAASMHYGGGRERPERVHVVPAGAEKYTPEDMCGFPVRC